MVAKQNPENTDYFLKDREEILAKTNLLQGMKILVNLFFYETLLQGLSVCLFIHHFEHEIKNSKMTRSVSFCYDIGR